MFSLKSFDYYRKARFWIIFYPMVYFIITGLLIGFLQLFSKFLFNNISINIIAIVNFAWAVSIGAISFIVIFLRIILKWKVRKMYVYECISIIVNTKLPEKLPKVVYVYTTHDDFMPARMLQNMQQTYTNIEYWISDGSELTGTKKTIDNFIKKHKNVHLYRMKRPSKNKADNLNSFLANHKSNFDYLMISDADVAIQKDFVDKSLKFFYCNNQRNLAFVVPTFQDYGVDTLYSNCAKQFINNKYIFKDSQTSLRKQRIAELASATALISCDFLKHVGYKFPKGNAEDIYLAFDVIKMGWTGFCNPLCVSMEEYEHDIIASNNKNARIIGWNGKYTRTHMFYNNTNKYKGTLYEKYSIVFSFPFIVAALALFPVIFIAIYDLIVSGGISNYKIWGTLCAFIPTVILLFVFLIIEGTKTNDKYSKFWGFPGFLMICFYLSFLILIIKIWWKYVVFDKTEKFIPTHIKKQKQSKRISGYVVGLIIASLLLFVVLFTFIWFNLIQMNYGCFYSFILLVSSIGLIWLSFLSTLILYGVSLIPANKSYNENEFVYCKNKYLQFNEIIAQFNKKNKNKFKRIL